MLATGARAPPNVRGGLDFPKQCGLSTLRVGDAGDTTGRGAATRRADMDERLLLAMIVAAAGGMVATLLILRRERRGTTVPPESELAVSTEGMKICPKCRHPNLWSDRNCVNCRARLPG
jgi:hypothetical protein